MICYVVLHYKNITVTKQCLNSLMDIVNSTSRIIVVDNGSANGTYEELEQLFGDNHQIIIIQSKENLGFARGNNLGYRYALQSFNPKAVVVCNSDLIFEQNDFESKLIDSVETKKYDVIGPDIINMDGLHQNPHRLSHISLKKIKKMNARKRIFLAVLRFKKIFPAINGINILEKKFDEQKPVQIDKKPWGKDIVLQGSCIVFCNQFLQKEELAFCPETFLYFEEDLLTLHCMTQGYNIGYEDSIYVKHMEGGSTGTVKDINKRIFVIENMLKSGEVYENHIKNKRRNNGS